MGGIDYIVTFDTAHLFWYNRKICIILVINITFVKYKIYPLLVKSFITPWEIELLLGPGFEVAGSIKLLRLDAVEFWDEFGWEDNWVGEGCFVDEWDGWARFNGWSVEKR